MATNKWIFEAVVMKIEYLVVHKRWEITFLGHNFHLNLIQCTHLGCSNALRTFLCTLWAFVTIHNFGKKSLWHRLTPYTQHESPVYFIYLRQCSILRLNNGLGKTEIIAFVIIHRACIRNWTVWKSTNTVSNNLNFSTDFSFYILLTFNFTFSQFI